MVESIPAQQLLGNSYARELFFRHTNTMEVLAQMLPQSSGTTREHFAAQLYEDFITKPRRPKVRKYIEAIRFDTRYAEGMFRLALKVPISSAQEHTVYQQKLTQAGIKKMCFVDMIQDNLVLEHKEKVVNVLKERFGENWPLKLGKLPKYMSTSQRLLEDAERRFICRLKHQSSLKGGWLLQVPEVVQQLTRESRIPSEQRKNLIWATLRFDNDYLNKKYSTGDYSRFQNDVDIEPEDCMECQPQLVLPVVQRTPCPIRAGYIAYESDTSLNSALNEDVTRETHDSNNRPIEFVAVQNNLTQQNAPLSQHSSIADSEIFTPLATSTQNQSQAIE
ncbi:uncharacterized protein LOC128712496 [Anopheles marshallii]|uniref:uncharacterized protein LOC128712496 n=1 Tax=Anopheles marshallii TaxID=1521116 RepID=UPI00237BB73C|nr:uncharacterized protein LOC128712496 [Anopheles marshallii]